MFRFLTAGESHGKGLTIIIEGMPAGVPLSEEQIAADLRRRQGGYGRGGRMQIERDYAEITAGVRHGRTLGSPIALFIQNRDWVNWQERMAVEPVEAEIERVTRLRPGHADLTGALKYDHADVRNVLERASARETAARVAAGAVARQLLTPFGVELHSHTVGLGGVALDLDRLLPPEATSWTRALDWQRVEESPLRCADPEAEPAMIAAIDAAKSDGDTVGGQVMVVAEGVPVGLGSYVQWDRKLDARIALAMMSINAVKGVGMGVGPATRGSESHDVIEVGQNEQNGQANPRLPFGWRRRSNRAGGVEGGISNGDEIVVLVTLKPIPTLASPLPSVDLATGASVQAHYERSDVAVVPAAGVVGEAMLAITLAQAWLEKFGGDSLAELRRNVEGYRHQIVERGPVEAVVGDDD